MAVRKTTNFFDAKVMPFLKKYGLFLLAFIVAFPYLLRFVRAQVQKTKEQSVALETSQNNTVNNTKNPTVIADKTAQMSLKYPNCTKAKLNEISGSALKIAIALGTDVDNNHSLLGGTIDLFNISAMTEDEATAVKLLKKYPGTFPILEDFYYNVHTKSRNLKTDCLKYLSTSDLDAVRKAWKKFGNYKWF